MTFLTYKHSVINTKYQINIYSLNVQCSAQACLCKVTNTAL